MDAVDPIEILRLEFQMRCARNPHYSLRAFARSLGIAPGPVSELMTGKRRLTRKQLLRIAQRLGWAPEKQQAALDSVITPTVAAARKREALVYRQLDSDLFALIADWEHYAILSLVEVRGFRPDEKWIARRLGLRATRAKTAWERLRKLKLVERRDGRWKATQGWTTTEDIPSAALRKAHEQELLLAQRALDESELTERDLSSVTMAVNPAKLPLAKALIRSFRRRLARTVEVGEKTEVYNLNIQLFPLTRKESSHE